MANDARRRFRELHGEGLFVMPNPWDIGSARVLESLGFPALATTSLGLAASLGRRDQHVTRDELVDHVASLAAAIDVPLNVDAERCFADEPSGIGKTVDLLAGAGAAGLSIEDYNPLTGAIDPLPVAVERVAAAVQAARRHSLVLTARAENHFRGIDDLADTIARLVAFRDAGAEVVYAPGLVDLADIRAVVSEVGMAVNVLAIPGGPSTAELAGVGVRRVSTGGALARAAYGELVRAATELLTSGTSTYASQALTAAVLESHFPG